MNRKILTISVAAHVAVAAGLGYIQVQNAHKATVIELADVKKPKPEPEKKPPPDPPKPKVEPPKQQQRPRSLARPSNAPQPAAAARNTGGFEGVPDFGLALSGDGQGIAVAVAASEPTVQEVPRVKTLSAPPAPKRAAACSGGFSKPVPISVPKPEYPTALRGPAGNGKVRVKLTVDENGQVIAAEILSGMRDEFNQAALAAARRARFEPGTNCGNPVTASFTIAMRFSSG